MATIPRSASTAANNNAPNLDNINDFTVPVHSFEKLQIRRSDLLSRHSTLNSDLATKKLRLQQLSVYQDWIKLSNNLKSWIEDKIKAANKYLEEDEEESNFTSENTELVEIKLNKHIVIEAEVEKNVQRLDNLDEQRNQFSDTNLMTQITASEKDNCNDIIEELRAMWKTLLNLLDKRRLNLKRQTKLLKFYRQTGVFLFWVNEKLPQSESNDVGNNVDECQLILNQFDNIDGELGGYKVKLEKICELAEELLRFWVVF